MSAPSQPLRLLLYAALAAAAWLVHPFADALLVAVVAAILAWPLHLWLTRRIRLPTGFVTALTVLILTVGVVVPTVGLLWLVSREVLALINQLAADLDRGSMDTWAATATETPMIAWLVGQAGGPAAVTEATRTAARSLLLNAGQDLGQYVSGVLGVTVRLILKVLIFYLALATFFSRGDEIIAWGKRLSPLAEVHTTRLIEVFADFARNVVLAGIVAAAVQGAVAGLGYWLGGVDRPLLFAVLTGVLAFVPVVGTAAAWVPVTLLLLLEGHGGAAAFVAIWSLALTGTIDNLVKPLIIRGRSSMPPLLVFLAVFGGLLWFGVMGLLVGPVLMALLLALLHIYAESLPQVEEQVPQR